MGGKITKISDFMPFNGQYDFVEINTANVNKTIAHELGHGAFNLHHPFWTSYPAPLMCILDFAKTTWNKTL